MSASSDYGVSIVESFAPPENWLPGQEVNKDVYAVNTGNVAAFVEETVSGALTITKEVAKDNLSANSLKLTKAERYVVEAGAYLAGAFKADGTTALTNVELGNKVVSMVPDTADLDAYAAKNDPLTDFNPDTAGVYVFRRSIGVDKNTKIETFKYDGYYYDGQDFYKITDLSVVPDGASYAGDNVYTDGNIKSASFKFVEEETEVKNPVSLKYEAKTADHPNRLVATYKTATTEGDVALPTLAQNYDNALVAYEDALEEYSHALKENQDADSATTSQNADLQSKLEAYRTALKNLTDAEADRDAKETAKNDAVTAVTNANNALEAANQAVAAAEATVSDRTNVDNDAQADVEAAKLALYGFTNGGPGSIAADDANATAAEGNYKAGSVYGLWDAAVTARSTANQDARTAFEHLFDNYVNDSDNQLNHPELVYVDSTTTPVNTTTVTYNQLVGMNLEKTAQQLDAAKVDLYGYANGGTEGKLDNAANETASAGKYTSTSKYGQMKAAEDTRDQKMVDLYGFKNGGPGNKVADDANETAAEGNYKADSKYGLYQQALTDVGTRTKELYGYTNGGPSTKLENGTDNSPESNGNYAPNSPYGQYMQAKTDYETAVANNGTASSKFEDAKDTLAIKTQALADAKAAYEKASGISDGELKININLSDDVVTTGGVADKWQLLPNPVVDDTAYFYYTSILGPSETSAQLIDSVELDSSVTEDMFKRFDFDLNVGLKSAQIAMANDGKTILTTAADTTLDATAALTDNTSVDTPITWSATVSTPKYKATSSGKSSDSGANYTDNGAVNIKRLETPVKIGDTYYPYEITDGDDKYYGTALANNTVFINATESAGVYTEVPAKKIKLTADATIDNT